MCQLGLYYTIREAIVFWINSVVGKVEVPYCIIVWHEIHTMSDTLKQKPYWNVMHLTLTARQGWVERMSSQVRRAAVGLLGNHTPNTLQRWIYSKVYLLFISHTWAVAWFAKASLLSCLWVNDTVHCQGLTKLWRPSIFPTSFRILNSLVCPMRLKKTVGSQSGPTVSWSGREQNLTDN